MPTSKVLSSIEERLAARAESIARFAATGRSFEEWLNWEMLDALHDAGLDARPKPQYKPLTGEALFGDFVVKDTNGESVFVEVAIGTDFTQTKWAAKINRDAAKLARVLSPKMHTLQVLVITSRDLSASRWATFLAAIGWDTGQFHAREILAKDGETRVHLRAWTDYRG